MFASQKAFVEEKDALIDFLTFWHNNKKCCLHKFEKPEKKVRKKTTSTTRGEKKQLEG